VEVSAKNPLVGDHKLIILNIPSTQKQPKITIKRSWKDYSKNKLLAELAKVDFNPEPNDPQSYWNMMEYKLLPIINLLAPYVPFKNNVTTKSIKPSRLIKNKLNLRKRLIKNQKANASNALRDRIRHLNTEIKHHFQNLKISSIKRQIIPGNSKSLWNAVRQSKNLDIPKLPEKMTLGGETISNNELPDKFAKYFTDKVNNIVSESAIDPNVYNGIRKINIQDLNFMTPENVLKAVKSLKTKNCEGHDNIPQRILVDGIEVLRYPLSILFNKIYNQKIVRMLLCYATPTKVEINKRLKTF
jgi:hypothetical protein